MTTDTVQAVYSKAGFELLFRLHVMLKIAKIHEPNNENFQEQLKRWMTALEDPLREQGQALIQMRRGAIFLNRMRIKFGYTDYHINKSIQMEFVRREVGAVAFRTGLDAGEAARFVVLLAAQDSLQSTPFEELQERLQSGGFDHISVERADEIVTEEQQRRLAARMYFLGISHLREVNEAEQGIPNFHITKRWIQAILDHITDDESFLYGLTNIKNYDEYTLNHSVNVCILSVALGRRLGLSRRALTDLGVSAFLHDLGKLEIPADILNKPGSLNAEEKALMNQHSRFGAARLLRIQNSRGFSGRAVTVAFEHHFTTDEGNGNIFHKKNRLNLYSRIVKITDYFDALTTKRVYRRRAFTREEALNIMIQKGETEFDPLILKAFVTMIGVFPVGSLVVLDTGEVGIVAESNPLASASQRPKVKLITDREGNKLDGETADLTEIDTQNQRYRRTIVKTLDPEKYGIHVGDYFLARVS